MTSHGYAGRAWWRAGPRAGETVVTLDGVERKLTPEMTVIADDGGAIGVAGVMGGAATEVTARDGRRLPRVRLLHARAASGALAGPWGSPPRRATASSGASTAGVGSRRCDAASRSSEPPPVASWLDAPVDVGPGPGNPPRIFLRPARVTQLLGVELPWQVVGELPGGDRRHRGLQAGGRPHRGRGAQLASRSAPGGGPDRGGRTAPRLREISGRAAALPARHSCPMRRSSATTGEVRRGLVRQGLFEVSPLPTAPADGPDSVRLLNPLSSADGYLRRRLLPGLVRLVEGNWAQSRGRRATVRDRHRLQRGARRRAAPGRAACGRSSDRAAGAAPLDRHGPATGSIIWDLKGQFEAAVALAIPGGAVQVEGSEWIARDREGRTVGRAGPMAADAPPWAAPLFGYELVLDPALRLPARFAAASLDALVRAGAWRFCSAEGTTVREVEGGAVGGWVASCSSRCPSRATTGDPSFHPAAAASRSG